MRGGVFVVALRAHEAVMYINERAPIILRAIVLYIARYVMLRADVRRFIVNYWLSRAIHNYLQPPKRTS